MDILVLISTILAIIFTIAEISRVRRDEGQRSTINQTIRWGILLLILAYIAFFFYFGPKNIGDEFIRGLRVLNNGQMLSTVCTDSNIFNLLGGVGGLLTNTGALIATVQIYNESYNIFTREYMLDWTMVSIITSEPLSTGRLKIRSEGLFDFCIYEAPGLF